VCLRHLAFHGRFRRVGGDWFLELTPTYRFTRDGDRLDRFHAERLSGIKRIEGNRAVLSAVLFWADYLSRRRGLFSQTSRVLGFGSLEQFSLPVGIEDAHWSARDLTLAKGKATKHQELLLPFTDVEPE